MENQKIKLREYKFRGLRTDGKWVFGMYNIIKGESNILVKFDTSDSLNHEYKNIQLDYHLITETILPDSSGWNYNDCFIHHQVIPETVGQLIHVEKSGYEWYEGDFAKIEIYRAERGTPFGGNEDEFIGYATGEVCLHIRHGLCLKNYRLFDENNGVEVDKSSKFKQITMSRTVIIGNVHEHKHLLTDGKEN